MSDQIKLDIKDQKKLETVEGYKFEPIKGYPMLHWKGKRPFTSTQYYPAQLKENHGQPVNGWMNRIYWGDNLQVMSHLLKEYRGKVDLEYIDPPFDSKADYKRMIQLKGKLVSSDISSFEEKQYTDIWVDDGYLQYMHERFTLLRELLSETGVLAVHCDIKRSHYLKVLLDEVFGSENARTELIVRTGVKNVQSQFEEISAPALGHNSILLFSKSTSLKFRKLQSVSEEYEPGKWDTFWRSTDRPTMRYKLFSEKPTHGQWRWSEERALKAKAQYEEYLRHGDKVGLDEYYLKQLKAGDDLDFVRNSDDGVVQYYVPPRQYKMLSNVWLDIPYRGTETDYPTEKNEAILERLINWITDPGDLVLDTFMGSGTTQAVAMKLGRQFIGADINLGAVQTATKRLIAVTKTIEQQQAQGELKPNAAKGAAPSCFTGFSVYNVNNYDIFRNPVEAKELLIQALEIQPLPTNALYDGEKDGRMVKIMPINRIATKADLNDLLTGFDYKSFQKRREKSPNKPVESLLLVCMGHEPDLAAYLKQQCQGFDIDVEVVDILRDKANLEFKRDSQAEIKVQKGTLKITAFYPMNLLQKLSITKDNVKNWREYAESVMIDWNYDGAVFEPATVDVPEKDKLVKGEYPVPKDAGTIRVKITDLLSESLETDVANGK
ncbi:MAG: site-specific DNA-methyltransferase [Methylococcales bacterium]|nr:MAG: site-specific DNA-methyltransferase [Methylococcales bacterium]